MNALNLLPAPRSLNVVGGFFNLPARAELAFAGELPQEPVTRPLTERLQAAAAAADVNFVPVTGKPAAKQTAVQVRLDESASTHADGYQLIINRHGVRLAARELGGLRAGAATLSQLLREYGVRLPCLVIRDHPDFPRRGVMLDVSRGRVPKLETLLELVEHLSGFKINEFQLYTEHTFAYRKYQAVWREWGALTAAQIRRLDARCRELGIDLVPNQNSFGHLRYFLEHPPLRKLAEISEPYEGSTGDFLRYPTTLAPNLPETLRFLCELYDELLPNFSSSFFNVGCDETWDLGRGQSRRLCERKGRGRVYLEFLRKIHREVTRRGRRMMFWGDIILHHPELIRELPRDVIALNWGYEANHPFEREAAIFAASGIQFYVCPGTSTWMSLIGRHDNGFANLARAAKAGRKHGAIGYLNTEWGDGGHPQPLAVSYAPFLVGAAMSWCARAFDERLLVPVLSREVFADPTQRLARATLALGFAHRRFGYCEPNITPYGAVIAAPPPATRELFCRSGLKYYARIPEKRIRAALAEVAKQRADLLRGRPLTKAGRILQRELDLATRMAMQSCKIMLWQQALASGRTAQARRMAGLGIAELRKLERDFNRYWPTRNQGTPAKCAAFLRWRMEDYRSSVLHFPPEAARWSKPKINPAD
jgi:hexosaminidase